MKHDHCTCTVEVSPDEADAGTDIAFKVHVTPPRKDGLRGARVSIRNHEGAELAQAELKKSDGDIYESNDIILSAPRIVGEHVYRVLVVTADKTGRLQEHASTEVHVVVRPHVSELTVWDVPSAIVAGEPFKFRVGVKSSAACCLAGQELSLVDQDGALIGTAKLGDDVWPDTDALYVAEVEGKAPPAAGNYRWEVRIAAWELELPHAAGSFDFGLKVVNRPDCEVTIEAFDTDKQTPIKGARVVMHPYRAMTDENGVAKLKVSKGPYDILVSASKYIPVNTTVEVTADMITRAELDADTSLENPDEVF